MSFLLHHWRSNGDYKQLKQAVRLQTIKYLIKAQHEAAFGKEDFWCAHNPSSAEYI